MDKKYKSLRTGNTKTYIPKFQPVRTKKELSEESEKSKDENRCLIKESMVEEMTNKTS